MPRPTAALIATLTNNPTRHRAVYSLDPPYAWQIEGETISVEHILVSGTRTEHVQETAAFMSDAAGSIVDWRALPGGVTDSTNIEATRVLGSLGYAIKGSR